MSYVCERPDYRLRVEGEFAERGCWMVHAVLEFGPPARLDVRPRVLTEARLELVIGISRESRRGREVGAKRVVVIVDGDQEIADFFELHDDRGPEREAA